MTKKKRVKRSVKKKKTSKKSHGRCASRKDKSSKVRKLKKLFGTKKKKRK